MSYAQIPLGNFIKMNTLELNPGAKRFTALRSTTDTTEFLAYSNRSKLASLIFMRASHAPELKAKVHLPFGLSALVPVRTPADSEFIFLSAHKRLMGVLRQTGPAEFSVVYTFKLTNFPSDLLSADIDNDGLTEVIAYGANFPGFLVLDYKNHGWRNKVFEKNRTFSTAVLTDVNGDVCPDLTAFDLKSGSLDFFYNNSRGEFSLVRSLNYVNYPSQLSSADMNGDGFPDITCLTASEFEVLLGDSVHSYSVKKYVPLPSQAAAYVLGDFNDDGKMDIAFTGTNPQDVSILFQRNNSTFYPAIQYLAPEEVADISCFQTGNKTALAILCDRDFFRIVDRFESTETDFSLPFASAGDYLLEPRTFSEKILLAYIDMDKGALPVISVAGRGKYVYYSFPLFGQFSTGFYTLGKDFDAAFYLTDYKKQNVQTIRLDLKTGKIERTSLKYDGRLLDLDILHPSKNEEVLSVLTRYGQAVKQALYNPAKPESKLAEFNIDLPGCKFGKAVSSKLVIFSTENEGAYQLWSWIPGNKAMSLLFKSTSDDRNMPPGFLTGDIFNDKKRRILAIFTRGDEYWYRLAGGNDRSGKIRAANGSMKLPELSIAAIEAFSPDKPEAVLLYSSGEKCLYQLDFKKASLATLKPLIEDIVPVSTCIKHLGREADFLFVTTKNTDGVLGKKITSSPKIRISD